MKTALFTNMYLHGNDPSGHPRIIRALKFLTYYRAIQDRLGFSQIYVTDNGGTGGRIGDLLYHDPSIKLIRHPHLERGKGHDYLPCWRTTHDWNIAILDGFDKIICVDDDAYILSNKLINHIKYMKSGWEAMWCPRWNFPECGLHIMCKDSFHLYQDFLKVPYWERNNQDNLIEKILSYTVNKTFNTDRWGELRLPQAPGMDAYFQCPVDIEMKAEEE